MVLLSLLEDCENCLSKGHESWKNYFSKWENLAKEEEGLPEDDLVDAFEKGNEEIFFRKTKKKLKTLKPNKKKFGTSPITKKSGRVKKKKKKLLIENKKEEKDKGSRKIIERPVELGNENLPEEADNEQLELDLRTVVVNILKANKNKWEIFSVLSQAVSNGEVAVKSSTLVLNQPPAISFNDDRIIGKSTFSSDVRKSNGNSFRGVGTSLCEGGETQKLYLPRSPSNFQSKEFNFSGFYNKKSALFSYNSFSASQSNCIFNSSSDFVEDGEFSFRKFRFSATVEMKSNYLSSNGFYTPSQNSYFDNRHLRSCPPKTFSSRCLGFSSEKKNFRRPLALEFGNGWKTEERCKINNEFIRWSSFQHDSDVNFSREKSSQNLCLHKRTNDVSLNMENSNFITPKRKLPERKCLSENILQRKRRRPSKLSLFDIEDESESDDDRSIPKRSPLIRWETKKKKVETPLENVQMKESDSSDDESIFDTKKNHQNS